MGCADAIRLVQALWSYLLIDPGSRMDGRTRRPVLHQCISALEFTSGRFTISDTDSIANRLDFIIVKILFLTFSPDITGADLSMLALAQGLDTPCCIASLSDGPFLELASAN